MKPRVPVAVDPPAVRPWCFPAVDPVAAAPPAVDPARFIAMLGEKLGVATGMPVMVTCDPSGVASPPSTGFVRGDGMRIAVTVPADLVGALVGVRYGGAFVPAAAAGAGGAPVAAEIIAAIHAAADAAWPGGSGWQPAAVDDTSPMFALGLAVAGHGFSLPCAVAIAAAAVPVADTSDWRCRLHTALDATPFAVRAVIHDRTLPLKQALALRVGDVLPIETRRDVSLRLGGRALARGTIAPDDDGGHRVTIVAVGDPGITPASKEPS